MKNLLLLISFISFSTYSQLNYRAWRMDEDNDQKHLIYTVTYYDDTTVYGTYGYMRVDTFSVDILTDSMYIRCISPIWNVPVTSDYIVGIDNNGALRNYKISELPITYQQIVDSLGFVPSAFSGSYIDLTNKPTIPTNTNQLTNGAGFLVSADIAGKLSISDTTSMLAPYMRINNAYTKTQSDSRYYLLSDTFPSGKVMTSNAANNAISGINNDLNGKAAKVTTLTINGVAFDLSANRTWSNVGIELPSQTGQAGKALITNGSTVSWGTVLTAEVDGSTTNEIELPSQTGNAGKVLQTNGSSVSWVTPASAPGTNYYTSYSAGTGYNITTTSAKIDFTGGGSNDPSITLGAAGTYVITSNVRIDYNGLTNLAANTVTVKLRRINNTAADLADATGGFTVPPVTLLTSTGGDCDVNTVIYTTANNNDVIELWASRSASISVGNIVAGNAWIVAHRIY